MQRKESMFKDGYEKDITNNLKSIKNLQQQIVVINDLNQLEKLCKENNVNALITFKSL